VITETEIRALIDDKWHHNVPPSEWLARNDVHEDALDETATVFLSIFLQELRHGHDPWLVMFGVVACCFQLGWDAAHKYSKEGTWPVI